MKHSLINHIFLEDFFSSAEIAVQLVTPMILKTSEKNYCVPPPNIVRHLAMSLKTSE